jgi:hypothetical protein
MNHIGAVIDASFKDSIPPLTFTLSIYLIDEIDFIIGADDILLNLLSHFLHVLRGSRIQEFINDGIVLLPLAALERNQAIVFTVFLY